MPTIVCAPRHSNSVIVTVTPVAVLRIIDSSSLLESTSILDRLFVMTYIVNNRFVIYCFHPIG
mgnify:CR=1 FL=1